LIRQSESDFKGTPGINRYAGFRQAFQNPEDYKKFMEDHPLKKRKIPVHPGEILRDALLPQFGITPVAAAISLDIDPEVMLEIVSERRSLTAEMSLRIAHFFGSSPEMWLRLQASYDLHTARHDERVAASLSRIIPIV
jgi:addiction module HigA family antidote